MKIIHASDAIRIDKTDGTKVAYYLQPEYEIHYNKLPPGTIQKWHSHNRIEEAIFILDGQLEIRWIDTKSETKTTVNKGDLIRVEKSIHTFANVSAKEASFLVFKTVLEGRDNSKIFKEDKISVSNF